MAEILRRSCGKQNFHEHKSEHEITDTIKTGKTRKKKFAAEISLLQNKQENQK